jgi:hypothetical protein
LFQQIRFVVPQARFWAPESLRLILQSSAPMSRVMLSPEQQDQSSANRKHKISRCERTELYRYLYAARLWLAQVRCPECGLTRWYNVNPKGRGQTAALMCDGEKFQVVKDDYWPSLEPCFERTAIR